MERMDNFEFERLHGLEVDDEFEPSRLHHRRVGRLLALGSPSAVDPDLAVRILSRRAHQHVQ